jgi:hypothetical protein
MRVSAWVGNHLSSVLETLFKSFNTAHSPLAGVSNTQARGITRAEGLSNALCEKSMTICFIGEWR